MGGLRGACMVGGRDQLGWYFNCYFAALIFNIAFAGKALVACRGIAFLEAALEGYRIQTQGRIFTSYSKLVHYPFRTRGRRCGCV